ncbi:hypothetical protein HanOQP8_Chr02g0082231 [Helianthus annuus]|nr:hypothetical protein HanIR_Chr02g0095761 [Helianthus annuus]KAJ0778449.1 hypothetical protein HanLR1_Chr02g0071841 [Helianthus annuus]KAJ0787413.1 hypothetical protein HanOQP8_Chr02g0082231 [Helianthus annuus]
MAIMTWELPVLYAIMTGELHLSFTQLVMMHVWQSRNMKLKKLIPHARLLSALLEKQGALSPSEYAYSKPHTVISIGEMCKSEWISYVKTKKWHTIKYGDGAKVKVLKWGKEAPQQGEMDDMDTRDEKLLRRKREAGMLTGEGRVGKLRSQDIQGILGGYLMTRCKRGWRVVVHQNMRLGRLFRSLSMIRVQGRMRKRATTLGVNGTHNPT